MRFNLSNDKHLHIIQSTDKNILNSDDEIASIKISVTFRFFK